MSLRNLDRLFKPQSIALIGASKRAGSVGSVVAQNLFHAGFAGPVLPVHPEHRAIEGVLTYNSVDTLPVAPDLAVIATPPDSVPGLVAELGQRGTRAAVVITAGFGEGGESEGQARRQAMLDAARPYDLRIIGPNCLGVMVPSSGLDASFSRVPPLPGNLAFVAQSGAIVTTMLDWAKPRGIGFSHVVSLGDMADVDFGDMLDYLAIDHATHAILLYIEAVKETRKFMSAARAAARIKPVIVIKGGRHEASAKAATSHTGALAGSDRVYEAAFARAGMLRVRSLEELAAATETLASGLKVGGDRLAILTNGGGLGVLAADAVIDEGGRLAELAPETLEALDAALPATWSHGNPIDIIGDATGERYAAALEALTADPGIDAIVALNCPTAVASPLEAAEAIVASESRKRRPLLTAWLGEESTAEARALFGQNRIPTYETPEAAVHAFMHLVRYRRHQDMLMETPPSAPDSGAPASQAARTVIAAALRDDRTWLTEPEAKAVLEAYGIPVVPTRAAATPEDAAKLATVLRGPFAVKILSPDISHKSDVGGVALNLDGPQEVRRAADAMLKRVAKAAPEARIEGVIVEEMARTHDAVELILGIVDDLQFGPGILFGQGGTAVELHRDTALALPPLTMNLAKQLMAETRIYRLLQGYRNQPAADLDAIAATLIKLAQLSTDLAEVRELDINPLLANPNGVLALDARIKVAKVDPALSAKPEERLAIRPYPKELEERFALHGGEEITMRPIRPEDAPLLKELFSRLAPEDRRLRFFTTASELSETMARWLTQIDYNREMALAAFATDGAANDGELGEGMLGVARIIADADNRRAEFAVTVRSDLQRHGLGRALMLRLLAYARDRGLSEVWGHVLKENKGMIALAKELGFAMAPQAEDAGVFHIAIEPAKAVAA